MYLILVISVVLSIITIVCGIIAIVKLIIASTHRRFPLKTLEFGFLGNPFISIGNLAAQYVFLICAQKVEIFLRKRSNAHEDV